MNDRLREEGPVLIMFTSYCFLNITRYILQMTQTEETGLDFKRILWKQKMRNLQYSRILETVLCFNCIQDALNNHWMMSSLLIF